MAGTSPGNHFIWINPGSVKTSYQQVSNYFHCFCLHSLYLYGIRYLKVITKMLVGSFYHKYVRLLPLDQVPLAIRNDPKLYPNTFHSPTDSPQIPGGIQGFQVFRGELAGMSWNSRILADSGGIREGICLQFT